MLSLFCPFSNVGLNFVFQISFLVLILKFLFAKTKRDSRLSKFASTLPGPFALPFVGNALSFRFPGKDGVNGLLMEYSRKYGAVYRLWIGKTLVISVSNAEYLEAVLHSPKAQAKPELSRMFYEYWGNGLFTAPMHIWKITRRRLQPFFLKNVVKLEIPFINQAIYEYVELLRRHVGGPAFDVNDYLPYLAVDTILKTHFGLELYRKEKEYYNFHKILQLRKLPAFLGMFLPWLRFKFISSYYLMRDIPLEKRLHKFSDLVVREKVSCLKRRETFSREITAETLPKVFLSTLYHLEREMTLENYMHDEIKMMVAAASNTTSQTFAFFLLAIAMYPKIQEKLFEEIVNIIGEDNRHATFEDIQRMPYLDRVIKETRRRFTVDPIVVRNVEEDLEIGSTVFPAGSTILIHISSIHLNPDLYSNPMEFNPENFNPEAVENRPKHSFIPFSAGTRDCIGRSYAEIQTKLVLTALLRNFSFHTTEKIENIRLNGELVNGNVGGFFLSIKSRSQRSAE